MKVLQITHTPFPQGGIRVKKECRTLLQAGYDVTVLAAPTEGRPEYERWEEMSICRPEFLGHKSTWASRKELITLRSTAWQRAIAQTLEDSRPDIVHLHDVYLAGALFPLLTTERLVIDLHENLPAAVREWRRSFPWQKKLVYALLQSKGRYRRHERRALARADVVLVVVEEAQERVLSEHVLPARKVVNVENLASREFMRSTPPQERASASVSPWNVLYIGSFGPHRGLDTLVDAMVYIKEWGLSVRLDLIGGGNTPYGAHLARRVERHGLTSFVRILDPVEEELIPVCMQQASVCAVPHHSNEHTDTTIPHKLFQYMIARRPVLVSSSAPLARTVEAADAGLVFRAGDARSAAEAIKKMSGSGPAIEQLGQNGFDYVMRGHNWEDEAAPPLLEAYAAL